MTREVLRNNDANVKINYEPLMEEVTQSINRWMSLPLSMIGRINILKMNILPKILYLFQNIPLPPPDDFFNKDNKLFSGFIWGNYSARVRQSLLYQSNDKGGLKSPNILWYYWAVQLRTIKFYFATGDVPQWKEMESENLSLPLSMYLYSDKMSNLIKQFANPVVKNMIRVWFKVKKFIKEPNALSQYSPIWGNQYFAPGRADAVFRMWASKDLRKIKFHIQLTLII